MPTDANLTPDRAAAEVNKFRNEEDRHKATTHEERMDRADILKTEKAATGKDAETAAQTNAKYARDDKEVYKASDNAEASDSNRPYEDVIMPEAYDADKPMSDRGAGKKN